MATPSGLVPPIDVEWGRGAQLNEAAPIGVPNERITASDGAHGRSTSLSLGGVPTIPQITAPLMAENLLMFERLNPPSDPYRGKVFDWLRGASPLYHSQHAIIVAGNGG